MASRLLLMFALYFVATASSQAQVEDCGYFHKELLGYLQSPGDTIYIEDRKKLEHVSGYVCNDSTFTFQQITKFGDTINIRMETTPFVDANHVIAPWDTVYKELHGQRRIDYIISHDIIDGKRAYGVDGGKPRKEFKAVSMQWGNTWIAIPDSAFHNLYDPTLCGGYLDVEIYVDQQRSLLYLYFIASDGAGGYAAKIIFNRKQYLTRIVSTYEVSHPYDFMDAQCPEKD